jgi:hypothetical protein
MQLIPDALNISLFDIYSMKFDDGIILNCGNKYPQIYLKLPEQLEKPNGAVFYEITYTCNEQGLLRFYWDYGYGICEENSLEETCLFTSEPESVIIPISNWKDEAKLTAIRIDPPNKSIFIIKCIRILEKKIK